MNYPIVNNDNEFKNRLKQINNTILEELPSKKADTLQESTIDSNWENSIDFEYFLTRLKKSSDYINVDYLSIKDEFNSIMEEKSAIEYPNSEINEDNSNTDHNQDFFEM